MDVREDIVINRRTGEIVGYTNLSKVEEELAALESEIINKEEFKPKLAKKVLVYMAFGVSNPIQDIVAVYTTSGSLTAAQLYSRTWNVVYRMESYGNKILSLICDGASTNKKFFRMHAKLDTNCEFVYGTKNLACGEDRNIFFIVDPVHGMKSLKNNFANSFSHKKTRRMWKNGEIISWKVIEVFYSIIQKIKYQETKLTKSHVKLTSYSCMKVINAAQVMSISVVVALEILGNDPSFDGFCLNELKKFITLVNNWFDCMNGSSDSTGRRNKQNDLLKPYTSTNDERFKFLEEEFLAFFEDWLKDVLKRPGNFSKDSREKMFISMQTFESIQVATRGFIKAVKFMLEINAPFIDARKFNQDKIEQFFGLLRMAFGGSRNPSAEEVIQKTLALHVQGQAAKPPSKGNTKAESQEWIPDQKPLNALKSSQQ